MKFTPKSAEEIQLEKLWPKGIYPFAVKHAEEKTSKKGNAMFELELIVYNGEKEQFIRDWLMIDQIEKLEQFCRMTGMADEYKAGDLQDYQLMNKEGYCFLKQQDAKGEYPAKNAVSYYCPAPNGASALPKKPAEDDDSDCIPF